MSFTSKIKTEISNDIYSLSENMAELSGILNISVKIEDNKFEIYTENASVAKRIYKLLKDIFNIEINITKEEINRLKEIADEMAKMFKNPIKEWAMDEIEKILMGI